MTPQQFIAKWQQANLSERSACQQHFLDLCELLGQPKPAEADPRARGTPSSAACRKTGGGQGWADVWMRGHFGWEYKGKHKDLDDAYQQLLLYREDLENPPLLVVCDMDRFEVHTNFTGTAKQVYAFDLAGLAEPANLDVLRKRLHRARACSRASPARRSPRGGRAVRPSWPTACAMRGVEPQRAAHFLMKLMFCMFGEDIGLLPPRLFARLLETAKANPASSCRRLETSSRPWPRGGDFGADEILLVQRRPVRRRRRDPA